jgi:hypothetical protein
MSCPENYNELIKENKKLFEENKKNKNNNSSNLDKFNSMIDEATEAIMCDSSCQKKKQADQLKQNYLDAQTNLARAPDNVYTSRKNYIVYSEGPQVYDELIDSELTKKAKLITQFYEDNFNDDANNVLSSIKTYDGLLVNVKNVFDLFLKYKKENVELTKKIKEETNDILTNERKTYYQDQGIDNLKFYYFYFLVTIYVICVLAFGIFNFIYPSQMSFIQRMVIFILFIILPFLSTWILAKIVMIIYSIYGLLPKNVHKTL